MKNNAPDSSLIVKPTTRFIVPTSTAATECQPHRSTVQHQVAALPTIHRSNPLHVQALQRTVGNHAVAALLTDRTIQARRSVQATEESVQRQDGQADADLAVQRPNQTGLPDPLKASIEALSDISLDNVKVHYNSSAPEQMNALAYAQGRDIHIAPGQERHLAHEAWHVVQQAQGRVQPNLQLKDAVAVNTNEALEQEADVMAGQASPESGIRPSKIEQKEQWSGGSLEAAQGKPEHDAVRQKQPGEQTAGVLMYAPPTRGSISTTTPTIQGIFIYTYPAGTIVDSPRTAEEVQRFGFIKVTYKDIDVWADARNGTDALDVLKQTYNQLLAKKPVQDRAAQAGPKGSIELPLASLDLYDVTDDDISFMYNGEVYDRCPVLKLKDPGSADASISKLATGTMLCIDKDPDPTKILKVNAKMVKDFWETPRRNADDPVTMGSFSSEAGYTPDKNLGPDERYNCAAYAHGIETWLEPEPMHELFKGAGYEQIQGYKDIREGAEYVLAYANHFIKIKKSGDTTFETSEKNGFSGVYTKTMTTEQIERLASDQRVRGVYKKV